MNIVTNESKSLDGNTARKAVGKVTGDAPVAIFPAVGRIASQRLSDLDAVAAMSEQMLEVIDAGNWDALPAIQDERDTLLRACFGPPLTEADSAEAVIRIKQLLHQNQTLLTKVTEAKDRLARDRHRAKRDLIAVGSYLSTGV